FSPHNKRAFLFSTDLREGMIHVLDLSRGELQEQRRIHTQSDIFRAVLSLDGRKLAILTADRVLALWDVPSGINRKSFFDSDIIWTDSKIEQMISSDLAFSPDGGLLAIVKPRTGILLLWELESGVRRQFSLPSTQTSGVSFLPGGAGNV